MPSSALRWKPARPVVAVSLVAALAFGVSSCTVIGDLERVQCSADKDCSQRGGAFADSVCRNSTCVPEPTWGCLGKVVWDPPVEGGLATVKMSVSDLLTGEPTTDATARTCEKLDTKCENPIAEGFTSDAEGILTVQLVKGFKGFLEISAPGKINPLLYFFYPPITSDRVITYVPLVSYAALGTLAAALNKKIDDTRGAAIALSYDCQGNSAAGLSFSVDEQDDTTLPFFMQKGLPTITATETDISGQGGFVNVTTGIRTFTGTLRATNTRVGTLSLLVRPGLITYTTMVPSPE